MIKWYDNNISESTLEEQILNNLKKSGPFYTARWIAEGIENAISSPVKKKHTSPDEWKKLERVCYGFAELEGTEEQFKAFDKKLKAEEAHLHPPFLSHMAFLKLALEYGLNIKWIAPPSIWGE